MHSILCECRSLTLAHEQVTKHASQKIAESDVLCCTVLCCCTVPQQEYVPNMQIYSGGRPACVLLGFRPGFERDAISDADLFNPELYPCTAEGKAAIYSMY